MGYLKAQLQQTVGAQETVKRGNPDLNPWSLGICRVVQVNYEEMMVTLRTTTGTSDEFTRVPVPLTMPGVGSRHFLGAMPEVGDLCVCGWMSQATMTNSDKPPTRTPVVLNWLSRGPWLGHDWMVEQPFEADEADFGTSRKRLFLEGVYQRTRHKRKHLQAGNILASSSQGSDLMLDESVTLSNRRGNEIRLRDQDQALVTRSLQQFHAMAGTRVYGGMVQRDATLLATTMVSDGLLWDGAQQMDEDGKPYFGASLGVVADNPVYSEGLPQDPEFPNQYLKPARILSRRIDQDSGEQQPPNFPLEARLDPYAFLNNGLFIDQNGYIVASTGVPFNGGTTYGGKRMFRTALLSNNYPNLRDGTTSLSPTFTEYRIEVAHTSDGLLPVTEQTDGFDADRLPEQAPVAGTDQSRTNTNPNAPFIITALGTVVGNDPYTPQGRKVYGVPLTPSMGRGARPTPAMVSALNPPVALGEQAATLFKLTPIGPNGGPDTFWSVKKNGQLRANIGGPVTGDSISFVTTGGVKGNIGGDLDLLVGKTINLQSNGGSPNDNTALNLKFPVGTVSIYAGGNAEGPQANLNDSTDQDGGAANLPTLDLGGKNVRVAGDQIARVDGGDFAVLNSGNATFVQGSQTVDITAGQKLTQSAEQHEINVYGKMTATLSGPASLSPASGPVRETVIQSALGGVVDRYSVPVTGDREETFTLGNHMTSIQVGNLTYQTTQGSFTARAGVNSLQVDSNLGLLANVQAGDIAMTASVGSVSLTAQTAIDLTAIAGKATVRGTSVVLESVGGKVGGIVSGADIEPFTGLPFAALGCGSPTQRLSI